MILEQKYANFLEFRRSDEQRNQELILNLDLVVEVCFLIVVHEAKLIHYLKFEYP